MHRQAGPGGQAPAFGVPTSVLEATGIGRWEWHPADGHVTFDDIAARLLGGAVGGRHPVDVFVADVVPDDADQVRSALRAAAEHGAKVLEEVRVTGSRAGAWARLRGTPVRGEDGRVAAVLGVVADTTELHAERERVRHRLHDVSDGVLALEQDWTISYANPSAGRLLGHGLPDLLGRTLWEVLPEDVESPVWVNYHWAMRSQRPVTFEAFSAPAGGWFEVRVLPAGGGLTVYLRSVDAEHEAEQQRLQLIGRLERALSRGRQLLELTEALSGQLDVHAVASTVTEQARRFLAVNFSGLALLDESGQWLEFVSLHPLPEETAEVWARIPLSLNAPVAAATRLRTAYFHDSQDDAERDFAGIAAHMRTAGTVSMVHLPLEGSTGHVLGTLALAWDVPHASSPAEQEFIRTMTAYCAQALERALLFEQQRTVADALQRAVLPASLPDPQDWALAARYVPATSGIEVGGDWYDAFELPDGRLGLAVGDASGHGLPAARVMSSLRNALRAYALLGEGPGAVLTRLDRLLATLDPEALATVVYLELEPGSGQGRWASAGHLPPLWCRDGAVDLDDWQDVDPPLGIVGPAGVRVRDVVLAPGDGVLLYTDGLVERPADGVGPGLDRLVDVVGGHPCPDGDLAPWLGETVDRLLDGWAPRDDICVLAVRHLPVTARQVTRELLPRPQAASEARRLTTRTLTAWGLDDLADTLNLVVSELVTNAVTHAGSSITFRVEQLADAVRVSVTDGSREVPDQQAPGPSEEHGRGVQLVDLLTRAWGSEPLTDGKRVWAEVPLP